MRLSGEDAKARHDGDAEYSGTPDARDDVKGVMRRNTDSVALYERTTEVARRHGCDRGTFSVCWGEYERGETCTCREEAKAELAAGK